MSVDSSGIQKLGRDIQRARKAVLPEVGKVVSRGALNVKRQIQKDFRASPHFKSVRDISYNLEDTGAGTKAEIGPFVNQDGFGDLVGIAIHGGSRGGGGTVPDPLIALQSEEPRFISALEELGGKILDE